MKNAKNCILTERALLLSTLIIQNTHAMDKPMASSTIERQAYVKELITHTIALPIEIKKSIFHILPLCGIESDNEFVKRIKTTQKIVLPDFYYFKNLEVPRHSKSDCLTPPIITTGSCPDNSHVAVLNEEHLQIIDTENHSIVYTKKCFQRNYKQVHHIALSNDTRILATIHGEHKNLNRAKEGTFSFTIIDILTIKNIFTEKIESLVLPSAFHIAHTHHQTNVFAFNKEGTRIIVRGVDTNLRKSYFDSDEPREEDFDDMPDHLIVPVTINGLCPHLNSYLLFLAKKIMDGPRPATKSKSSIRGPIKTIKSFFK